MILGFLIKKKGDLDWYYKLLLVSLCFKISHCYFLLKNDMLIIHPKDKTTYFLCEIYRHLDCEVIRDGTCSSAVLRRKIREHDKIVFLGHGTENGLLRTPIGSGLLISSKFVQFLRGKECVFIWCNADKFVKKYGLSGFATGMIISEVEEAAMFCIPFSGDDIFHSNISFSKAIKPNILEDKNTILLEFIKHYPIKGNNICDFNVNNVSVF